MNALLPSDSLAPLPTPSLLPSAPSKLQPLPLTGSLLSPDQSKSPPTLSPITRPKSRVELEAKTLSSARLDRYEANETESLGSAAFQWMSTLWDSAVGSKQPSVENVRHRTTSSIEGRKILRRMTSSKTHPGVVHDKYRMMILMSDTGGGHRAPAEALAAAIHHQYPGLCEIKIVDIWTDYGVWPFNTFVPGYKYLCDNPQYWGMLYDYTKSKLSQQIISASGYALCGENFRKIFEEFGPHIVCSVHPLCQDVPLKILDELSIPPAPRLPESDAREVGLSAGDVAAELKANSRNSKASLSLSRSGSKEKHRGVPFVTVVTDLAEGHPTWFHPDVDLCFVPSKRVELLALEEHMKAEKIRLYGLLLREAFWQPESRPKNVIRKDLGLMPNHLICLVVGGGDGVGGVARLTIELVRVFGECRDKSFEIIVICGRNETAKRELESKLEKFLLPPSRDHELPSTFVDGVLETKPSYHLQMFGKRGAGEDIRTPEEDFFAAQGLTSDFICEPSYGRPGFSDDAKWLSRSSSCPLLRHEADDEQIDTGITTPCRRRSGQPSILRPSSSFHALAALISPKRSRRIGIHQEPKMLGVTKGDESQPLKRRARRLAQFDHAAIDRFRRSGRLQEQEMPWFSLSRSFHGWWEPSSGSRVVEAMTRPSKMMWYTEQSVLFINDFVFLGDIFTRENNINVHVVVKGFVNNMADWMGASDLIITKAGSGTIAEACTRGLPILLNCYLPGQEEGNVHFVVKGKFGGYSSSPSRIAKAACKLLLDDKKRQEASDRARAAVDPSATSRIADDIIHLMISRSTQNGSSNDQTNNSDVERSQMCANFLTSNDRESGSNIPDGKSDDLPAIF